MNRPKLKGTIFTVCGFAFLAVAVFYIGYNISQYFQSVAGYVESGYTKEQVYEQIPFLKSNINMIIQGIGWFAGPAVILLGIGRLLNILGLCLYDPSMEDGCGCGCEDEEDDECHCGCGCEDEDDDECNCGCGCEEEAPVETCNCGCSDVVEIEKCSCGLDEPQDTCSCHNEEEK